MGFEHLSLKEEVHRNDGTAWVLVKAVKNAQEPFALAVNTSGGVFSGFEVHILRVNKESSYFIRDKEGSQREIKAQARLSWRSDEDFGKKAWFYASLEAVYNEFPQFKSFKAEIDNKVAKIRQELKNLRQRAKKYLVRK